MSTRSAALAYARRGWHVLPLHWLTPEGGCSCGHAGCKSIAKHPFHPLVPNGLKDATTDLPTIRRWYKQHPRLNVGIRTGAVSGLVVVDLDGEEGEISWAALDDKGRHEPTLLAITGSGGLHYYFAHPGFPVPNSASRIGPHIDIRGDEGYVVAPPSTHKSGNTYAWDGAPNTLSPVPGWLLPRLIPPTRAPRRSAPTEITLPGALPPIHEGQRNVQLASIAGRLRRQGADEAHIEQHLAHINARIPAPLSEREVQHVARSISRYEPGR